MRGFDISGTCNSCGRHTKVTDQTLPEEESLQIKEALLLLCHYHEGHTFELGEGDVPRIVPIEAKAEAEEPDFDRDAEYPGVVPLKPSKGERNNKHPRDRQSRQHA